MKMKQRGFTLIELMIVVSIIGVLAAIAVPVYQRYVIRSQISEGLALSAGAKTSVSEYFMAHGDWPSDNSEAGLADMDDIVGNYTKHVEVNDNVIEIMYGHQANQTILDETVVLIAADNSGSVAWTCASGGVIEPRHLPAACR